MKKKKRIKLSILMVVVIVLCGLAIYALKKTLLINNVETFRESKKYLKNNGVKVEEIISKINKNSIKFNIKSKHGHNIPIEYILSNNNYDNTTIVLVHGHGMEKTSLYPIADNVLKHGLNAVLLDLRLHGGNTAKYVTFGYFEKDDVQDVIDFIKTKMKKENSIGVLGQSMGAATVGMYSGTEHAGKNIKFAILDCPYNNMNEIIDTTGIRQGFKPSHVKILRRIGSIANKMIFGFSYKDVDVCKAVSNTTVPTLIYCVENDVVCPYHMANEIFDSIKHNNKEKIKFKYGGHINGFYKNSEIYMKSLMSFISKYK